MRWVIIVNPAAGRGASRRRAARRLRDLDLAAADWRARGTEVAVEISESADDAVQRARKGADAGCGLVAAGGDGTVGALVGVAAESSVPLVIVPLGSGNDFARVLGYDLKHPLAALDLLDEAVGVERTIDLGRANGRWYAGVTCSGFDAEVNRWANTVQRLSGSLLYVVAVVRTLAVYRPRRFAVTIDGRRRELDAWMVSVANSTTYGGGMKIAPDARLDDGQLDVCIIGATSKFTLIRNFPKVFSGSHGSVAEIEFDRGTTVTVEAIGPQPSTLPQEVFADGERVDALPATMVCVPGALQVRVPR